MDGPRHLGGLEGLFLVRLRPGSKAAVDADWPRLRLACSDLADHRGNVGLLLGPVYPCGGGILELDIDNPEGLTPTLDALRAAGLEADAVIHSGGEHRGWKVLFWVRAPAWAWTWPHGCEIPDVDVRGAGCQCVIPPSAVEVPYTWTVPLPPMPDLLRRGEDRPEDFEARLYHCLYGCDPLEAPCSDDGAPLPETLPEDLRRVLEALAAAGLRFQGRHGPTAQLTEECLL
ncbi:MAG: bifunctional DNA primase/polymerase, partial [Deltaproteobacteria bacterium]|nr:bifunctional DNA primase/polymerase [Deltaproteobacteria bacterium]